MNIQSTRSETTSCKMLKFLLKLNLILIEGDYQIWYNFFPQLILYLVLIKISTFCNSLLHFVWIVYSSFLVIVETIKIYYKNIFKSYLTKII